MINPAVETDLVGDLVEVYVRQYGDYEEERRRFERGERADHREVQGRGRVRAVTAGEGGNIRVWLEIMDETCAAAYAKAGGLYQIGDIAVHDIYETSVTLRLIRSP